MSGRAKRVVVIAGAVAGLVGLIAWIAALAAVRTDDGRELAGRVKSTGRRWFESAAATSRSWIDQALGASHGGFEIECVGIRYALHERRASRWSSLQVSAKAELCGATRLARVQLRTGVDRNGDGRISGDEWKLVASAESPEGGAPTRLEIADVEVAEGINACWVRIEGEPFHPIDASWEDEDVECEYK